ncbi:CHAT domain-containing protein [Lentzea albidocapillata subsp. violacea]|uniref:CHAT domain-containing protein n=1 Tax=Lentzea albidocapillata subsp. violacea TaxID=128104 RepID=A0A1G8SGV2_9PSEU|nr:CHAT domain-containing protein [Lentzea albidocapillata]SDJ28384.1 CHAT domain-containing protein [Lentzea albidocapillata subsp. violacea]
MSSLTRLLTGTSPAVTAGPVPAAAQEVVAELPDAQPMGEFVADISTRLDQSYAMLVVNRAGPDAFTITGKHRDNRLHLRASTMPRPELALGDMADNESAARERARNIRYLMQSWSRQAESLREWVERLRATVGDGNLRLVVWDDTGYEIPWELLYLPGDEQEGRADGWLGQLLAVTRMVTIHSFDPRRRPNPLELGDHVCTGDAVAWAIDDMRADLASINRFNPLRCRSNDELLDRLYDTAPLGLVYIAAHGKFSDRMTELTLDDLGLEAFDYGDLPGLHASHGLVFMNACHSGRLLNDVRVNLSLFGFAELFLRQGAATVIGAAGKVDTDIARTVADQIFQEIVRDPAIPVAEAVRLVRARAATRVDGRRPAMEALKEFLYTFMYVCYGNPFTRLAVPPDGGGDD